MTASVIVPTLNRRDVLLDALSSVFDADVAAEVIVVDSGSTDGSLEELRALGDRIRLVEGAFPNAAATRNAGAAIARGRYLAFLDSDDAMLAEKVTCLAPLLDADPSIALAHGTTIVIDEAGRSLDSETEAQRSALAQGERKGTTYRDLAEFCAMFTSATLVRRSAFEQVGGYDDALDAYEDWDLYLRLALSFRLVYAPCVTARYRLWPGNVPWNKTAEWTVRVASKHLALVREQGDADPAVRYAFERRLAFSNHVLMRTGASRAAALSAIRIAPARALRDRDVRRPLLRSFLPTGLLRRRRP